MALLHPQFEVSHACGQGVGQAAFPSGGSITSGRVCFQAKSGCLRSVFPYSCTTEDPSFVQPLLEAIRRSYKLPIVPSHVGSFHIACCFIKPSRSFFCSNLLTKIFIWCNVITGLTPTTFAIFCQLEASHGSCPHSRGSSHKGMNTCRQEITEGRERFRNCLPHKKKGSLDVKPNR